MFPCHDEYVVQLVQPKDTNRPKKAPKTTSHARKPPSGNDSESLFFSPWSRSSRTGIEQTRLSPLLSIAQLSLLSIRSKELPVLPIQCLTITNCRFFFFLMGQSSINMTRKSSAPFKDFGGPITLTSPIADINSYRCAGRPLQKKKREFCFYYI